MFLYRFFVKLMYITHDNRIGTWEETWYPARIVKSHKNGYYEVDYKDGYRAMNVPVEKIQSIEWHNMVDKLEREKVELIKSLDELKLSSMNLEKKLQDANDKFERSKKDVHDLTVALDKSRETTKSFGTNEKGLDSNDTCVICVCATRSTVLIPCRHMCVCPACAEHMQRMRTQVCPLCREAIESYVNVYR